MTAAPHHELWIRDDIPLPMPGDPDATLDLPARAVIRVRLDGWAKSSAVRVMEIVAVVADGDTVEVTAPDGCLYLGTITDADDDHGTLTIELT